ncbi:hypothetical protein ANOM_006781 [Aspergillus nomiae NRRL 13137]|uniref:DUF1446 domain protein n=1 Tax=Aspergillus nomiae NRRL (strain ATCC 15546 / NRRL 13137 / CBS 260.88 / M93) TaxID=1509407 RepID=A0A0L1J0Q7_ASPN3|nr:uncharacterized protein ANOM_006781 [Aspergillus nomiae NRRL 13137]KNG84978.1 hypothetical protein ANOM_006781 [Aspergillus nomiae NRRL 13137]
MLDKRPVRIGNVSGATGDHPQAMLRMAQHGNVDVIVGDWLSEMNIAWNAITKSKDPNLGYESGFLTQLSDCLDIVVAKDIKLVANAGALNTSSLMQKVCVLCKERGYSQIIVASVLGDDISQPIQKQQPGFQDLHHLDHVDWKLKDWSLKPHCAVAYIGAWGIVEALNSGADIVICGRVTDASPVIGAAAWWYRWQRDAWDELAGALVAGHLIECGPYVTGANFSGFKPLLPKLVDLSFPVAEVSLDGSCIITKCEAYGGAVTKSNTISQLLYELQGELYLNPDVAADLRNVSVDEVGPDRVRVYGTIGQPPPSTTKAMIAAPGGYQAEAIFYINGLDVTEKAEMLRSQLDHALRGNNFSKLSIELYGSPAINPSSQQAGTVFLRVFAQARNMEDISAERFKTVIYALRMQSYPGYHMNLDFRMMDPKPFMEMFPAVIPLDLIHHEVILSNGIQKDAPSPPITRIYPTQRPSYETKVCIHLNQFGDTDAAPLGSIVHARSGDKGDNFNVGFFVRNSDEYPWLQSFLTIDRFKALLGDDWPRKDNEPRVERCEFTNLLAVHFRVLDFLDGGIASSSRIDGLGKGIGEYLRSRVVEVPKKFLERGWI